MNASPASLNPSLDVPELSRRLGEILAGLAALVAARFLRVPRLMGLTVLLWTRLGRAARRFARLMARPKPVRSARVRVRRDEAAEKTRSRDLPCGRGWLVRELGYEAVAFGCQLEALLAEPGMQAMLAALPGAGRILRPICRMLGVKLPEVALPEVMAARVVTAFAAAGSDAALSGWIGRRSDFSTSG